MLSALIGGIVGAVIGAVLCYVFTSDRYDKKTNALIGAIVLAIGGAIIGAIVGADNPAGAADGAGSGASAGAIGAGAIGLLGGIGGVIGGAIIGAIFGAIVGAFVGGIGAGITARPAPPPAFAPYDDAPSGFMEFLLSIRDSFVSFWNHDASDAVIGAVIGIILGLILCKLLWGGAHRKKTTLFCALGGAVCGAAGAILLDMQFGGVIGAAAGAAASGLLVCLVKLTGKIGPLRNLIAGAGVLSIIFGASWVLFGNWIPDFVEIIEDDILATVATGYGIFPAIREIEWVASLLYFLQPAFDWIAMAWYEVSGFFSGIWNSLPVVLRLLLYAAAISAAIGIVYSHIEPIVRFRGEWLNHPDNNLMYSYFMKSGTQQMAKKSYAASREVLRDNTLIFTISGLAYRLGNLELKSKLLAFLVSIFYVPLLGLTFVEMSVRVIVGTAYLFAAKLVHRVLIFAGRIISYLLTPVIAAADRYMRRKQYCAKCYVEFQLPVFKCSCGREHKQLTPGRCGIFFARCACNTRFLPVTVFSGRSSLDCACPECGSELAAANANQFFVHLIGGSNTGKTAYLAALAHLHLRKGFGKQTVSGKPQEAFSQLEEMFSKGTTFATSQLTDYSFLYGNKRKDSADDALTIYDINGEQITGKAYAKNPRHFAFCHGFILFFDPLCVLSVKEEQEKDGEVCDSHAKDDFNDVVNQFILQFSEIRGGSGSKKSDIPVAVVISKADLKAVKREVGGPKIRTMYKKNSGSYKSEEYAKNKICRSYLESIGSGNALGNIDALFNNVAFFPVSAMGQREENAPYEPSGVTAPLAWIARAAGRANIAKFLRKGE